MSKITKGVNLNSVQSKRFLALEGYVFGALGIKGDDVGTIDNLVKLVNDVFEARLIHDGNVARTIDLVWGYVAGLSRGQRKVLRRKNLAKVPYPMKGANAGRRQALLQKQSFYSKQETEARRSRDVRILEDTCRKTPKKSGVDAEISKKADLLYGPTSAAKDEFYKSWEWRTLRMEVIKQHGRNCQCCGATPRDLDMSGRPVRIVVDHIKPISKFWGMRLDRENLQVLCDECNQGKGNWDETDFRKPEAPDEWVTDGLSQDIVNQLTDLSTGKFLQ